MEYVTYGSARAYNVTAFWRWLDISDTVHHQRIKTALRFGEGACLHPHVHIQTDGGDNNNPQLQDVDRDRE